MGHVSNSNVNQSDSCEKQVVTDDRYPMFITSKPVKRLTYEWFIWIGMTKKIEVGEQTHLRWQTLEKIEMVNPRRQSPWPRSEILQCVWIIVVLVSMSSMIKLPRYIIVSELVISLYLCREWRLVTTLVEIDCPTHLNDHTRNHANHWTKTLSLE